VCYRKRAGVNSAVTEIEARADVDNCFGEQIDTRLAQNPDARQAEPDGQRGPATLTLLQAPETNLARVNEPALRTRVGAAIRKLKEQKTFVADAAKKTPRGDVRHSRRRNEVPTSEGSQ
jgi:hypothetical protein